MIRIALTALLALGAAAALFATAGAASDGGAQEPPAVAQQQQQARPTGSDWTCSMATRGFKLLSGYQRGLIDHFHYQITEQEVCRNSETGETWNGPTSRRSYWVCRNTDSEVVTCPSSS